MAQWVRSLDLTTHTSLSPIRRGFAPSFVHYKKGCTRLAAASDNDYQLLAQGRWFSPASSTTKTGRHDIAEILLKVALNTKIQIQIHTSLSPLRRGFAPHFINYKRGCTRLAATRDKVYTNGLPMVGGSLRIFRLFPPLKLVAMI